jgi:hypothetical protein
MYSCSGMQGLAQERDAALISEPALLKIACLGKCSQAFFCNPRILRTRVVNKQVNQV